MSLQSTKARYVFPFVFFVVLTTVLAQRPGPTPRGPEPELQGGFTFSSTKKDGRLEWKVEGSSATFVKPNLIDLRDVRAVYFPDDGTTTVATTEQALLDREKRRIKTDEFVTIVTENSVITGTGFEWDQGKRKGRLKNDVKVVYKHPEGKGIMQ